MYCIYKLLRRLKLYKTNTTFRKIAYLLKVDKSNIYQVDNHISILTPSVIPINYKHRNIQRDIWLLKTLNEGDLIVSNIYIVTYAYRHTQVPVKQWIITNNMLIADINTVINEWLKLARLFLLKYNQFYAASKSDSVAYGVVSDLQPYIIYIEAVLDTLLSIVDNT